MFKIYTWSDNRDIKQVFDEVYVTSAKAVEVPLAAYNFGQVELFKLHKAIHYYGLVQGIQNISPVFALKADLADTFKTFKKLAKFSTKNIIGEDQVVSFMLDGDVTVQASQYSSAIVQRLAGTTFKKIMRPEEKLKLTVNADDLYTFISIATKKIIKDRQGSLMVIGCEYTDDFGSTCSLTAMAFTYKGGVTAHSSEISYDANTAWEYVVVGFFEGECTPFDKGLLFPELVNWYGFIKGGKVGCVTMCKHGPVLKLKSLQGLANITGNASIVDAYVSPTHDPSTLLSKPFASYNKKLSYGNDNLNIDIEVDSELFSSVLSIMKAKDGMLGIPLNGGNTIWLDDDYTRACVVIKATSKISKQELQDVLGSSQAAKDLEAKNERKNIDPNKTQQELDEERELLLTVPVANKAVLLNKQIILYADDKAIAQIKFEELKRAIPKIAKKQSTEKELREIFLRRKAAGISSTPAELIDAMTNPCSKSNMQRILRKLSQEGVIMKDDKGKYYMQ